MEALKLQASSRQTGKGHAKNLRQNGLVPAVMYSKGNEAQLLQIEAKPLDKVISVAGTHQLISIQIDNEKPVMTLAREIQMNSIRREFLHVDFYIVDMDEKVTADVPLVLVGESPAVRDQGGILTQGLDQLEIECLPGDLIASIEVNVDGLLEFNDSIIVSDLQVPDTVTVLSDPESMVAKIEAPRKAEDLDALDEAVELGGAEPEVITEAREEDKD